MYFYMKNQKPETINYKLNICIFSVLFLMLLFITGCGSSGDG